MGNSSSTLYLDKLSDDSDSNEYEDALDDERPTRTEPGVNLTTDAAPRLPITLPPPEHTLNVKKLDDIENLLDEDEIVALVYLLFDDNHYALQELSLRLQCSSRKVLTEWARLQESNKNCWQKNFVEALFIIQNYRILRKLGYSKDLAIYHYLPHQPNTSLHVNKMRKLCYILCEKMKREKTHDFINLVKRDMNGKGHTFSTAYNYLEIYFLEMEIKQYITRTDISNVKKILKAMDQEDLYTMIQDNMIERRESFDNAEFTLQNNRVFEKEINIPPKNEYYQPSSAQSSGHFSFLQTEIQRPSQKVSTTMDNQKTAARDLSFDEECISSSLRVNNDSETYQINPNYPGVVLIINEEDFYTEVDEKYKSLLPTNTSYKLEERYGSQKDRDNLTKTFEKFGFEVIVKNNLIHTEIVSTIKTVLSDIKDESSLFICILSHGDEGIVYASNSCSIKVSKIQKLMYKTNKTNLLGKPKFLILQSCQGQQCQKIKEDPSDNEDTSDSDSDDYTTDNGGSTNRQSLPKTADMFTFWATVPGYAAVRNKKTGSWFIQSFCEQIENLGNRAHFADICTSVIREVTEKKWNTSEGEVNVTTPMVDSTLRKFFFLPPMKT